MEIMSGSWRPRWGWQPRFVMFTSYWPDPTYFIAYGTNGTATFALRGTWENDLKTLLAAMAPQQVSFLRLAKYPDDEVEVLPPTAAGSEAFLPPSVSTNPANLGGEMA